MIKENRPLKYDYTNAECDACGESLLLDDERDDIGYAHHAELTPKFGYAHPYDSMHGRGQVVCGTCWQKVLIVLDLPVFTEAWGSKYMADGRIIRTPEGEEYERETLAKSGKCLEETWNPDPKKRD